MTAVTLRYAMHERSMDTPAVRLASARVGAADGMAE